VSELLKHIIDDAKRRRSPKENEAAERYVLRQSPIKDYLDAVHEGKKGQGR
jgi:hypothetical protein